MKGKKETGQKENKEIMEKGGKREGKVGGGAKEKKERGRGIWGSRGA